MNNNQRGIRSTSQKQSYKNSGIGTRHSSISTPNNNIHININLNVKKKSQCIIHGGDNPTGKKINNFIQVNDPKIHHQGSSMTDDQQKQSQQLLKSTAIGKAKFITTYKKPQVVDKKMQKTKKKKTKQKEKTASKPFTPQKQQKGQSQQKSFQRSKTGKKLVKKKESKSMQNLKVFKDKHFQLQNRKAFDLLNPNKDNKFKSKSNSSSKQRSRQKSATKLKKNRSSSKNIMPFQNSGIKKVLVTQRQTNNKNEGLQHLRKSKKSLKSSKHTQKDLVKIHEFMQEKRKNDQRKKKQPEYSTKGIKIKDEILKASTKQKKQFFSKHGGKQVLNNGVQNNKSHKNVKFPIYFGDEDDNNNEVDDSSVYHIQRYTNNVSNNKTPQKSRIQSLKMSPQGHKKSSTIKKRKQCLMQKYKNSRLTSIEYEKFIRKIVKIQAYWRGYITRKKLLQQLTKINRLTSEKKRLINEKKSEFWDDDDNNSIINLDFQVKNKDANNKRKQNHRDNSRDLQQQQHHEQKYQYYSPQGSNYNSSSTPTDQIHTNNKKYQSQSGNQLQHENKLRIEDFKKNIALLQREKQELKGKKKSPQQKQRSKQQKRQQRSVQQQQSSSQQSANNSFLVSQIQLLKKQLQEQNKRFTKLQKQNHQLKENLMLKKQEKSINIVKNDEEDAEICGIKMISNERGEQSKKPIKQNKFKNLKIQTGQQVEKPIAKETIINNNSNKIDNPIKSPSSSSLYIQSLKHQLSSFQSPSNRTLKSAQLSGIKDLQKAFKKKQLSIELTYEKNSTMYQQMLQNNIVSPRTYNFKKIELDEKYKKQKEEINSKFKQVEKVIKYISEEIVVEEKAGEDESPKKQDKVNNNNGQIIRNIGGTKITQAVSMNVSEQEQSHSLSQYESHQSHVVKQIIINGNQNNSKQQVTNLTVHQYISPQIQIINQQNSSTHSNFRNYWTDDIDLVHKKVLQISQKIDEALLEDTQRKNQHNQNERLQSSELKSQQLREYSSQNNSDFYSINSGDQLCEDEKDIMYHRNQKRKLQNNTQKDQQSIYEQGQYTIVSNNKNQGQQKQEQQQVMPNLSNHSHLSDKSGRSLQSYNIHYPSSPSNSDKGRQHHSPSLKPSTHTFQNKIQQLYYDGQQSQQPQQLSVQGNNSQLSHHRQSLSENNSIVSSSTRNKQNKGFDTRLTFIKEYCIALCEFIRSQDQLKEKFIHNISQPLKYDYFQYLKSYRTTIKLQYDTKYNSTTEQYFYPYFKLVKGPIIQKGLNQENTQRFDQLYDQSYGINKELTKQMMQIRGYFIHAIIDVFNESLDFQRPGSIYGEPLPWLVLSRNLKNNHVKFLKQPEVNSKRSQRDEQSSSNQENEEDERLDKIFGIAIAKIIQWGSCLCGFIPQPVSFDGQQAQAVNIDQEQTNLVRQTRLAYMLQKSLAEDEQKMVDHTMEQLEVQLQLQQIIFKQLISQCVSEIALLGKNA